MEARERLQATSTFLYLGLWLLAQSLAGKKKLKGEAPTKEASPDT